MRLSLPVLSRHGAGRSVVGLREVDSNHRAPAYEAGELPSCSIPHGHGAASAEDVVACVRSAGMGKPLAYKSVPEDAFPFTIELIDYDTDETVWSLTVEGPRAIEIPSMRPRVCKARVTFATGETQEQEPCLMCPKCANVSYNINDVREGYCGHCHDWTCR